MSIKDELNNSKTYLKDAREALVEQGCEISSIVGLKDLPEAIFKVTAGSGEMYVQEETQVASIHSVPENAELSAIVKQVGGLSVKYFHPELKTTVFVDSRVAKIVSTGSNIVNLTGQNHHKLNYIFFPKLQTVTIYASCYYPDDLPTNFDIALRFQTLEGYSKRRNMTYNSSTGRFELEITLKGSGSGKYFYDDGICALQFCVWDNDARNGKGADDLTYGEKLSNFQISLSKTDAYAPYEMVDFKEIPEVVRKLDGYGIGNSDFYNSIVYQNGRWWFWRRSVMNGEDIYHLIPYKDTDITDDMQMDPFIKVKGGGAVVFYNTDGQAVIAPSTLKYLVKAGT